MVTARVGKGVEWGGARGREGVLRGRGRSGEEPGGRWLGAFAEALAPPLARITGKAVRTVDLRAYAYRVGHYLLPHADHQEGLARQLAFAYYLPSPEPPVGGELELYACEVEDGALARIRPASLIEPRANRLVVFDVSDVSLHQVREVTAGLRISLAGWFYP